MDLASAPNPSRDIHYTDLPKEYATSTANPPLSTIDFIGVDDGNANPKFFRPTAGSAPAEDRLVKDSFLPFGAVISPLCQPLHPEEQVPVIRDRPPVRCHRCRGYISCHVRFTEMGRNWSCPLCGMSNAVEEQDFCNLDSKGRRLDRGERPELSRGSVEYDVDAFPEYSLKGDNNEICPTRPLHHLFLLDVSKQAMSSFLPDYVQAIREALQRMAEATPQCRVSFITFASQLHFYNFQHPELPQLCVPDIANPFVPLPFSNLCWLEVGFEMERIERFLDRVLTFAQDLNESDCALGAAVKAATLVLAGQHGGRVIMCANRHPQCGVGAITPREYQKTYGTEKDKELLRPIEGFWTTTATEAAKQQISFDAFLFPTEYCELVTISHLSHVTNGRVFLFPNYDPLIDNTKVQALMTQIATEEAGYAGILRVRCSSGLTVQRYRGHYLSQDVHDMDLANITGSSTFFVDFAHESKLEKNSYVHFQAALLYTTRGGSRRVRVHSYRIPVATTLSAFFGDADLEATLFGVIQETLMDAVNKGLKQARDGATDRLVKMLTCYRRYCTSDSNSTTLLMPSRLKLLPIFTLCLLKSDALAYGTTVRLDDRVQSIFDLVTMPIHKLIIYLYPSLFNAVNIVTDNKCGELHPVTQKCVLPRHRQLIFDSILKQGVYILCDEQARLVYMWIGPEVPAEASRVLFGGDDASQVGHAGGPGEEQFCDRLRNVLYALMLREDGMRRLIIVHSGERAEEAFFKQLKEEHDGAAMGHDEYLVLIHKAVNRALA